MACNCSGTISECIKAFVSPCDLGITTNLIAPVDGNYLVLLEGTNSAVRYIIEANEGDIIILANNIHNNYGYSLQIFKPDGELLNDTCYSLQTILTLDGADGITPSPTVQTQPCTIEVIIVDIPDPSVLYTLCNGNKIQYQYPAGNTLQILGEDTLPYLPGLYVQRPVFLANGVYQDMPYNSSLGTFDNTVNGGFNPSGDIDNPTRFTINYAQPI